MSDNAEAGSGARNNRRKRNKRRKNAGNARREAGGNSVSGGNGGSGSGGLSAGSLSGSGGHFSHEGQKNSKQRVGKENRKKWANAQSGGDSSKRGNRQDQQKKSGEIFRRSSGLAQERLKWVPPEINTEPLPVHNCPWCGKPIREIAFAMTDKSSGAPVHFECVAERLSEREGLEKGDVITYIGGGRFGVVCFNGNEGSPLSRRTFKIKKIIEWEDKDKRSDWRVLICDRYSIT
ncbi:MAG: hypothetical protein LBG93_03700 [Treponema sp.]|jgi:hypothetical protein|nr:hypothetical protein [Treponema sp.]